MSDTHFQHLLDNFQSKDELKVQQNIMFVEWEGRGGSLQYYLLCQSFPFTRTLFMDLPFTFVIIGAVLQNI